MAEEESYTITEGDLPTVHPLLEATDPWTTLEIKRLTRGKCLLAKDRKGALVSAAVLQVVRLFRQATLHLLNDHAIKPLLEAVDGLAEDLDLHTVRWTFSDGFAPFCHIEPLLESAGYVHEERVTKRLDFTRESFTPTWAIRLPPLGKEVEIHPWEEAGEEAYRQILFMINQGHTPWNTQPEGYQDPLISAPHSFVAVRGGQVVGWLLTEKTTSDCIKISQIYAKQGRLQGRIAAKLVARLEEMTKKIGPSRGFCLIHSLGTEKRWRNFMTKRLLPYAVGEGWVRTRWKLFRELPQ